MKNKVKIATIYFFIFYELKTKKFVSLSMKLRKKCLYSDFFWSEFSSNVGKYRPEKL